MKRSHVHAHVERLDRSMAFYSKMFDARPTHVENDYAKWMLDEGETTCCYARSDKYWITDPQGIAWEQFHTLGSIPVFSERQPAAAQ